MLSFSFCHVLQNYRNDYDRLHRAHFCPQLVCVNPTQTQSSLLSFPPQFKSIQNQFVSLYFQFLKINAFFVVRTAHCEKKNNLAKFAFLLRVETLQRWNGFQCRLLDKPTKSTKWRCYSGSCCCIKLDNGIVYFFFVASCLSYLFPTHSTSFKWDVFGEILNVRENFILFTQGYCP